MYRTRKCMMPSLTVSHRDCYIGFAGWSSLVARWAHNPKVGGSNPPPATNLPCGNPSLSRSRTYSLSNNPKNTNIGENSRFPRKFPHKTFWEKYQRSVPCFQRAFFPDFFAFAHLAFIAREMRLFPAALIVPRL